MIIAVVAAKNCIRDGLDRTTFPFIEHQHRVVAAGGYAQLPTSSEYGNNR